MMTESLHHYSTAHLRSQMLSDKSRCIRSRAIAIPSNVSIRDSEEIQGSSRDFWYELATWRMYSRIVSHRQKHPVSSVGYDNRQTQAPSLKVNGVPRNVLLTGTRLEDTTEDCIFDLEL